MNEESRPKAALEAPAKKPGSSVPLTGDQRGARHADRWSTLSVDLMSLSPAERLAHLSGYASGYAAGLEQGRALRMAEEELAWRKMRDSIRRLGGPLSKPYSAMCELRGEADTERAEAARAVERALGVTS